MLNAPIKACMLAGIITLNELPFSHIVIKFSPTYYLAFTFSDQLTKNSELNSTNKKKVNVFVNER